MKLQDFFEKLVEGPIAKTYAVFKLFLDNPGRKFNKKEINELLTQSPYSDLWTRGVNGVRDEDIVIYNDSPNVPTALTERLFKLKELDLILEEGTKTRLYKLNTGLRIKEDENLDYLAENNTSELLTWQKMFEKYEGLPFAKQIGRVFNNRLSELDKKDKQSAHLIVDFETPYVTAGTKDRIAECYAAIEECMIIKKIVYFSYYQPNKEPDVIEVKNFHPYLLKISRGQWYLIGKCTKDTDFKYIPLNRIKELVPSEDEFVRDRFNPIDMWKHSVGITRSEYTQKLSFKVKNGPLYNNIDYLINNPILPTDSKKQKPVIKDGWMEMVINEIHLGPELVRTLRSIGRENIKDLNPGWLYEDLWEANYKQEVRFNIELNSDAQVQQFTKLSKEMLRISRNNDNEFAEFTVGAKIPRVKKREVVIKNISINAVFAHYVYFLLDFYKENVSKNELSKLIQ